MMFLVFVFLMVSVIVISLSALAGRSQARMWEKCQRKGNCVRQQRHITMGKAHAR